MWYIYARCSFTRFLSISCKIEPKISMAHVCCCAARTRGNFILWVDYYGLFFLFWYHRGATFFDARNRFLCWRAQQFFVSSPFEWRPHERWKNPVCISVVAVTGETDICIYESIWVYRICRHSAIFYSFYL